MTRKPRSGRCVHCLQSFSQITWDHVLPNSWYPSDMKNIEKWNVPSCARCNNELGKIEERLLTSLGLCLDPLDPNSAGIPEKVLRSIKEVEGKDRRDITARRSKREMVLKNIRILSDLPKQGVFPNFGPFPGIDYKLFPVTFIEEEDIKRFAGKVVRGIAYISNQSYIEKEYNIEHYIVEENSLENLISDLENYGEIFERGSAFIVRRLLVENELVAGIYYLKIWERLKIFVTVAPKSIPNYP